VLVQCGVILSREYVNIEYILHTSRAAFQKSHSLV